MKITFAQKQFLLIAAGALSFAPTVLADVHLSNLFSDGAVLQHGMDVPIWGTADAGETIAVSLNGKQAKTTADNSGRWILRLPALKAGGPFDLTVSGKNTVVVHNVAVGEVWIASGQSNMEYPLETFSPIDPVYGPKAKAEIAVANDPLLRMFTVTKKISPDGTIDKIPGPDGAWKAATPLDAGKFSAVAYYYASELRRKLNVPVGIIHTSWGGTPAEAWTSRTALEANASLKPVFATWDKKLADFPGEQKKYAEQTLREWQQAVGKAKTEGKPAPAKPRAPDGPSSPRRPATIFNAMVNPLIPYGIKGVIWYQGESNSGNSSTYKTLFSAMIKDWRSRWSQGEFPFFFVQLANFQAVQKQPVESGWAGFAFIREAQLMTLGLTNTGMASAIDLADPENPEDVHPHNKREVGRRLSLIALAKVYNEKVASYSGPIYSGFKIAGNKARLSFDHADGGLMAKNGDVKGFAIAGKDGKFVWADAKIEGNEVVVSSQQVAEPTAIRYDWAMNPIGNLYNKEGLPASPFRTDTETSH